LGGTVTSGIVSALDREITIDGETMSLLQTDAAVNPGNSGGGLFNLRGELIGVVNAKSSGSGVEGLGFAIPVNMAKTVAGDLIAYGYVKGRLTTGFTLVDIQNTQTAMLYRVNGLGLYISRSSDAAFRSGDRIIAVNGVTVSDLASFNAALAGLSAGDKAEITVIRGGKSVTAPITLTELTS
jgi:serine protease Do